MWIENSDRILARHLCKALELRKGRALDKTHLVQIPVQYRKKDGGTGMRLQWVDANSKEAKEYRAKNPDDAPKMRQAKKDAANPKTGTAPKKAAAAKRSAPEKQPKPKKEPKPIGNVKSMDGMHFVETAKDVPAWITKQTGPIPPGWRFIQIADDMEADRLVCGYDYEGRMQTKYSDRHTQRQAAEKFERVAALRENSEKIAEGISGIRDPEVRDCLTLIMKTGLRPGSAQSAKTGHYGATTLLAEHVVVEKTRVYLQFVGKEGVSQNHEIRDPELRKMLKKRKREAEKTEDKRLFRTSSETLNRQFKAVTGSVDTSVKDLRTMKACETAEAILRQEKPRTTASGFDKLRKRVGEDVCRVLGNGRDMALKSYIDPRLFVSHSPVGFEKWDEQRKANTEKKDSSKEKAA